MRISANTRLFALLGDPVSHSLSPRMQNAGFLAAGLDAVYVAMPCGAAQLPTLVDAMVANGGGGNITIPHKNAAADLPGVRDDRVHALGVANVFGRGADGGTMLGNSDVDGILSALDRLEAPATAWHLLGTGGSARAVVGAARERGARIAVRSRAPGRGEAFLAWCASVGVAAAAAEECEVVINATPLGLAGGDGMPIDPSQGPALRAALDLTYLERGPTRWVEACRARGLRADDGRHILLVQGAASWRLWFPGLTAPMAILQAALDGRLG
ncbi:MAG: shikimate dehydrogenase [Gemmatimonadetes bacterium]|nr:shikimate dehydrogenase [Gemmatimonadota bacterium]